MPVSFARWTTTIIASVMIAAAFAAPASAISPTFDPPTGLDLAGQANTVAVGDFDGDGIEDRVVASNGNGTTYGRDRTFRTGTTPPPRSGGAPDTTRPRIALSAPRAIKRATLLEHGVRLTVAPDEPSSLVLELVGSARTVRLTRVGDVVLAHRRLPITAARRAVTLKLPQRFRSRLSRRFSLTIRVTATGGADNRTVTARKLRVR
jgi:hypothetical protein